MYPYIRNIRNWLRVCVVRWSQMLCCLPVISEQTDFSLCDAGQATGRPAARLWRTGLVWLTFITFPFLPLGITSGLSPRSSCSTNFSAFSFRVGSPGARDQRCQPLYVISYVIDQTQLPLFLLLWTRRKLFDDHLVFTRKHTHYIGNVLPSNNSYHLQTCLVWLSVAGFWVHLVERCVLVLSSTYACPDEQLDEVW